MNKFNLYLNAIEDFWNANNKLIFFLALLYILLIFILLNYFSELILIYMLFYIWDLYLPTFSNNFAFPFNVFLINVPSIIYCVNVHFKFAHKYVRHHTYCCQDSSKYFVVNSVLEGRNTGKCVGQFSHCQK